MPDRPESISKGTWQIEIKFGMDRVLNVDEF
jgi:hypothetical protein